MSNGRGSEPEYALEVRARTATDWCTWAMKSLEEAETARANTT